MKTIRDIPDLSGRRVLLRADFNVPLNGGVVADDMRIRAAMPTLDFLRGKGAKIAIATHLEAPDGTNPSLLPVARRLRELGVPTIFQKDLRAARDIVANELPAGECMLLENLRLWPGEKRNSEAFARELTSFADIYVNEAFPASHRPHASIVGVPQIIPGYAGLQLEKEAANLAKVFSPEHPFLFILGGAKFETKLPLLRKFLGVADHVFVGGALANDFFRARGYETGLSLLSKGQFDFSEFLANPKLLLPADVTNAHGGVMAPDKIGKTDKIMDAGPATLDLLRPHVESARFILWNGPLGLYEDGYRGPTLELARLISSTTARGATTIVGGGDTVAAIASLGISDKFTFLSTGGGAMLDFLSQGTLPGIEALERSQN